MFEIHGIKPIKSLGQNFLVNEHPVEKLLAVAEIRPNDTIIEIGPGLGILTARLAEQAKKVIAIEKDAAMVALLQNTFADSKKVHIIHGDALTMDYAPYAPQDSNYKVVANLPYHITAPTIRKFLEAPNQPESITLIIQKEVAQRICAKPPNMSILAVSVQWYAAAKIISSVKKSSFWPQPRVDSAIIHIIPHKKTLAVTPVQFFTIVKAGFLHPRKQLINNLSVGLCIEKEAVASLLKRHAIAPNRRAETLTIQDWINLAKAL